ncbi:MAG: 3'-5' exonuclease, partial [Brachybacterium sp.]|nr:3'-5' exonuclease [Brachybacterium sp.]
DGVQPEYESLDVRPDAPAPRPEPSVDADNPARRAPSAARETALESTRTKDAEGPAVLRTPASAEGLADAAAALLDHQAGGGAPRITMQDCLGAPPRPIRPQDIAILLRSRGVMPALEDALDARGIEYRTEASTLIFGAPEVREIRLLLRAIAQPADSGALVLALRSSLLRCGDDDLATWKIAGGTWTLGAPTPDEVGEDHPVAGALAELRYLAALSRTTDPATLLEEICERTLLHTVVLDTPRHRDVSRRLVYVIDQVRAWWQEHHGSLRDLLAWLEVQESESGGDTETVLDEKDSSAVRILTMHAAKGLEFPVVLLHSTPRARATSPAVLWSADGAPLVSAGKDLAGSGYAEARQKEATLLAAEQLRLMYVAATRAEHILVVPTHEELENAPAP